MKTGDGQTFSRLETTRGVFTVLGTPGDIERKIGVVRSPQKILKD